MSRLFEQLTGESTPAKAMASVGLQVNALKRAAAGKVALVVCDDMFVFMPLYDAQLLILNVIMNSGGTPSILPHSISSIQTHHQSYL